jgi:hypothetical protein
MELTPEYPPLGLGRQWRQGRLADGSGPMLKYRWGYCISTVSELLRADPFKEAATVNGIVNCLSRHVSCVVCIVAVRSAARLA